MTRAGGQARICRALAGTAKQRTAEVRGAEPLIVGYIPGSIEEREKAGIHDIDIVEAVQYYRTPRGQQPGSPNKLRLTSGGGIFLAFLIELAHDDKSAIGVARSNKRNPFSSFVIRQP